MGGGRSGVTQVLEVFVGVGPAAVPAAGGVGAADTGVLPGLLSVQAVVQQPVRPQALVLPCGGAGHRVAGVDLQGAGGSRGRRVAAQEEQRSTIHQQMQDKQKGGNEGVHSE